MAIEIPVSEFEALAAKAKRHDLSRVVLANIERRLETNEDLLAELTRDVDARLIDLGNDVDNALDRPGTCDCACNEDISDLQSDIDGLHDVLKEQQTTMELMTARLLELEAKVAAQQ